MGGLGSSIRRAVRSAYATTVWMTVGFSVLAGAGGVIATRALGPYERGLLATAVAWSAVAGSLSLFGVPGAAAYFTARDELRPPRAAATVIALGGLVGAVLAAVGAAVSLLLVGLPAGPAMAVAFAGLLPGAIGGAALGAVLGLGDYRRWGLLRMLGPALTLVGTIVVVTADWSTAVAITVVTAGAACIQLVAILGTLRRRGLMHRPARFLARPVLSYTSRNLASGAGWLVATRLDLLVLSIAVSPALLGMYAVAVSFGALIQPVAASTGTVALRRAARGGRAAARQSIRRGLAGAAAMAAGLCAVTFALAPQLVRLLFGDRFSPAVEPLRVLLVGTLALVVASILADTLRGLGRPLEPARAALVGAAVTLVGLPILLPPLDLLGAAIVSSASYVAMMLVMARSTRRALREQEGVSPEEPAPEPPAPSPPRPDRSSSIEPELRLPPP